jgi:hypothetical protein
MPTISYFFGIAIRIYFNEHPPPHFHALYGDDVGQVEIATGKLINGRLPRRVLAFVEEWRMLHVDELMEDWRLAQGRKRLNRIDPLE